MLGNPFLIFSFLFLLFVFLFRWYGSRHWLVVIIVSYWLSFLVFVILITEECNEKGIGIDQCAQNFIIASVLLVLISFTFGAIHLALNICL